ncbi:MAG: hypothetical protein KAH18_03325 [Psychromonas sp.]|nr:hypothetical protein [Psychromonas sp.]
MVTKITVEVAIRSEITPHLGESKDYSNAINNTNSRNGYSSKLFKGCHYNIEIQTPRDTD